MELPWEEKTGVKGRKLIRGMTRMLVRVHAGTKKAVFSAGDSYAKQALRPKARIPA